MSAEGKSRLETSAGDAGQRLDRLLSVRLDEPRNQVQRWIREGLVTVDGSSCKPSHVLAGGETVEYRRPERADERVLPEPGPLNVLHEDEAVVVLDKPAGLAMHPGAGRPSATLVNRLLASYPEIAGVGGEGRPGVVHRLDLDTTGVVVLARDQAAYRRLSQDFSERRVQKTYLAICFGAPTEAERLIDQPIGRHPRRRREMAVRADGRPARTRVEVLTSTDAVSLLQIDLETGRTHQIRVHLKSIGHPLVGDPLYGEARWKAIRGAARRPLETFHRPALHAWKLGFRHPASEQEVLFEAPPPADLMELWAAVGGPPPDFAPE